MEWVVSGCWAYRGVVINQHTLRTACIHTYIHSHFLAHPFIVCHVLYPTQGNATMELRGSAGGDKHHNSHDSEMDRIKRMLVETPRLSTFVECFGCRAYLLSVVVRSG